MRRRRHFDFPPTRAPSALARRCDRFSPVRPEGRQHRRLSTSTFDLTEDRTGPTQPRRLNLVRQHAGLVVVARDFQRGDCRDAHSHRTSIATPHLDGASLLHSPTSVSCMRCHPLHASRIAAEALWLAHACTARALDRCKVFEKSHGMVGFLLPSESGEAGVQVGPRSGGAADRRGDCGDGGAAGPHRRVRRHRRRCVPCPPSHSISTRWP